jgi:hypothetical protein
MIDFIMNYIKYELVPMIRDAWRSWRVPETSWQVRARNAHVAEILAALDSEE